MVCLWDGVSVRWCVCEMVCLWDGVSVRWCVCEIECLWDDVSVRLCVYEMVWRCDCEMVWPCNSEMVCLWDSMTMWLWDGVTMSLSVSVTVLLRVSPYTCVTACSSARLDVCPPVYSRICNLLSGFVSKLMLQMFRTIVKYTSSPRCLQEGGWSLDIQFPSLIY